MKTSFVGVATMACLLCGIVGCYLAGQNEAGNALIAVLVGQFIPPPLSRHPEGDDK